MKGIVRCAVALSFLAHTASFVTITPMRIRSRPALLCETPPSTPPSDGGEIKTPSANAAADAEEMTAVDYVTFLGYIGGFVAFFYAIGYVGGGI